ncbi:MAG TPA: phosphate acyltransferase PlsX [Methylomirabilota bacterium]|jgi:glycerol-3-phosphate acyltransferase PlsX|nr:phosphate acyltransferase PlsX [Methylomirabilota bacterium]
MRIAVDAMGGDAGPPVTVEGAVDAARDYQIEVVLVGDKATVEGELARHQARHLPVAVRHASQVVAMDEPPSQALRRKRDSSLRVAAELVRDGEAAAFISAGNTGAAMAIAMFTLGVLPGVDRPAIAVVLPNLRGRTILLDAGANMDPKPRHLVQYALMGHVYAQDILGVARPRVGLLSVGEEEGKGNELVREVFKTLEGMPLNFVGNVEGRDIYNGSVDVVVTDGFTGNVALKISESLADMILHLIREELTRTPVAKLGALLVRPAFRRFWKRVDYAELGGAPLLGINGACIISHGASPARAVKNAIRVAAEWVRMDVNAHIRAALTGELARTASGLRTASTSRPSEPDAGARDDARRPSAPAARPASPAREADPEDQGPGPAGGPRPA